MAHKITAERLPTYPARSDLDKKRMCFENFANMTFLNLGCDISHSILEQDSCKFIIDLDSRG